MSVVVEFDGLALIPPVMHDLQAAGLSPVSAIERAIEAHIFEQFQRALNHRLIKPPRVTYHDSYFKNRFSNLTSLAETGYETWYTEVCCCTDASHRIEGLEISSKGIDLVAIEYGGGISRAVQTKISTLKKQTNHIYKINHLRVGGEVFQKIARNLAYSSSVLPQPLIANFTPVAGSWPESAVSMFDDVKYESGICHLCIAKSKGPEEAARRYGVSIETYFPAFIDQIVFDLGVDEKTARREVMHILNLSRWVRESALYGVIRELFPDQRVLREASPDWLGRMRIDIYLPELKLAIEHQGEQHYRPIPVFGGEEAHARVVERDTLKRRLCLENGITVIDVRFDAPITKASLRQRLTKFLS